MQTLWQWIGPPSRTTPPFNLFPVVLNKVTRDKAPLWRAQPSWVATPPESSGRATSPHPEHPRHLLKDSADPQRIHPMFPRLHLAVLHISRNSTKQWEFLTILPRYSFQHLAPLHGKRINQLGDAGVIKERLIPFSVPLADILLYLIEYFNGGAAYRSVNVARSASSTTHAKLDGLPVGQHPLVIQLLKGMFNNRPPKPRYSHTWDVTSVTKYLASLCLSSNCR